MCEDKCLAMAGRFQAGIRLILKPQWKNKRIPFNKEKQPRK